MAVKKNNADKRRAQGQLKPLIVRKWMEASAEYEKNLFLIALAKHHYIDFAVDDCEWLMAHDTTMQQNQQLDPLQKTFVFLRMMADMLECDVTDIFALDKRQREEIITGMILGNRDLWEAMDPMELRQADFGMYMVITEDYFKEDDTEDNGSYHVRLNFLRYPMPQGGVTYVLQAQTEDYFLQKQVPDANRRFLRDNKLYTLELGDETSYLAACYKQILEEREDIREEEENSTFIDVDKLLAEAAYEE